MRVAANPREFALLAEGWKRVHQGPGHENCDAATARRERRRREREAHAAYSSEGRDDGTVHRLL
jgi:hypothetical protein